jgi:hypothetical protein
MNQEAVVNLSSSRVPKFKKEKYKYTYPQMYKKEFFIMKVPRRKHSIISAKNV